MATKEAAGSQVKFFPAGLLNLRVLSIVLVLLAVGVSGYLTYIEAAEKQVACVESSAFDCSAVQNSAYSKLMGIPLAYTGLAANLFLLALLLLENRIPFLQENGVILVFGIVFFAFLFSIYLIYVQAVLLEAFCQWCLAHEIIIAGLLVVTGLRVRPLLMD